MKRTVCGGCGDGNLKLILDLGESPVADAYTLTAEEPVRRLPLQLAVCAACSLVQLLEVVDHETLFGTGYSFYSSASAPLTAYHRAYAFNVLMTNLPQARQLTVEVGCNDGNLLQHFANAGCTAVGVDPASGPTEVARERGLEIISEAFTQDVASKIIESHGSAGVIIANHVLAHVESVSEVMASIALLLADDGVAFIEVQYLPDLLLNNAIDLIYHEHRNFFSLTSLEMIAQRHGLHVVRARLTERQGGSLRVTLQRKSTVSSDRLDRLRASEGWLHGTEAYAGLQGRAERLRTRLLNVLHDYSTGLVGYGAPAKATTLLNFCGITDALIPEVIDSTSAKQGKFIPGTGIKIVSESDYDLVADADTVIVLAWNYADSIMRKNISFTQRGGHWIIPIPAPVVL